jgi:YD repeat-containing protein
MKLLLAACALLAAPAAVAQETTTYKYDALGRLRESSTAGGQNSGTNNKIDYDNAGNRSKYEVTGATGTPSTGMKVIVVPLNGFTVIAIPNPWAAR